MRPWASTIPLAAAALVVVTRPAHAQVQVETQQSSRQVEVGQPFQVQLSLTSSTQLQPSDARLPVPANVRASVPDAGLRTAVDLMSGTRTVSVTLTWNLVASKPGTYRIGPPTAVVAGKKVTGGVATFEVVAPGQIPTQRGRPFPFGPFGGLPGMPGFPGFSLGIDEPQEEVMPPVPPGYEFESALDPLAFGVAKASPKTVVLGQAINYTVYAYGARGVFGLVNTSEPSRDGFIAYDVDLASKQSFVPIRLGDTTWVGIKIRQMVLFPIKTGSLQVGAMTLGFQGRGYPASPGAAALMRKTAPIEFTVVEPPVAGRPAGYRLGDVGRYKLEARVDPMKVRQGEAVSVIAKLEGEGNVPSKLDVPQQNGVDWAEPSVIHKVEAEGGTVRGSRIFTFVVRLDRAGSVDLGELSLPYYDPAQRKYEIARAALGAVEVEEDKSAPPAPIAVAAQDDRLKGLLKPRTQLGPASTSAEPLSDHPLFFTVLLAGPLGVLAGTGLIRLGRRAANDLKARKDTPTRRAARELDEARRAALAGDLGLTSAALERALHHAIEGATSVKGRGLLRSELGAALYARGLSREIADEVVALLQATETARFVEGEAVEQASDLVERGARALDALKRGQRG